MEEDNNTEHGDEGVDNIDYFEMPQERDSDQTEKDFEAAEAETETVLNTVVNVEFEGEDTNGRSVHVPSKFSFVLTSEEWSAIKVEETKKGCRKLSSNWIHIFSKKFEKVVPSCALKFKRNYVGKHNSRKKGSPFFKGEGQCKFEKCLSYSFRIKKTPREGRSVKVRVSTINGNQIYHEAGITKSRHFQGEVRETAKRRIKEIGSTNFFYERYANADDEALQSGNLTGVGNKSVIQKISSDINLEYRLHRDSITEVSLVKEIYTELDTQSTTIKGYVQYFAIDPFCVQLYMETQIRLLCDLIKQDSAVLYFDATGTLVSKIKGQSKPVFYYPMLLKGSKPGNPPLPLCEMITNNHCIPDVTNFLMRIYRACCQFFPSIGPPQRVEIDFSWSLIHGILLSFNMESICTFMARAAKIVHGNDEPLLVKKKTVIHICSAHVMHMVARQLYRCCTDKGLRQFMLYAFAQLIDCILLDDILDLFKYMCVLLLSPKKTSHRLYNKAVERVRGSFAIRPEENSDQEDEGEKDKEMLATSEEEANKLKDTYFAKTFQKAKDSVLSEVQEDCAGEENDYYCPKIADAFAKLMRTAPLWSGMMLGDMTRHQGNDVEEDILHDTNTHAEHWMKIVKSDVLQGKKRQRPGVVIRSLYNTLCGRVKEYTMFHEKPGKARPGKGQKGRSELLEEERWIGKKRQKEKYFQRTEKVPVPKKGKQKKKEQKDPFQSDNQIPSALHWGGNISVKGNTIHLSNTCPVDNLLYVVFRLCNESPAKLQWIESHQDTMPVCCLLLQIFEHFRASNWQEGRKMWLQTCCGFSKDNPSWNVFGSESERFVLPFGEIQQTISRSICSSRRCPQKERANISPEILLGQLHPDAVVNVQTSVRQWEEEHTVPCQRAIPGGGNCKGKRNWRRREFTHDRPPILIMSVSFLSSERSLTGAELPEKVEVLGKWYQLCGFTKTTAGGGHFIGYFLNGAEWLRYDGLSTPEVEWVTAQEKESSTRLEHIVLCLL